jgi:hypothetical protein
VIGNKYILTRLLSKFDNIFPVRAPTKYTICEILCSKTYKNLVQILKVTYLIPILLVYSTVITELYIFVDVRYSLKLLPLLLVPRIIVLILGILYEDFRLKNEAKIFTCFNRSNIKLNLSQYPEIEMRIRGYIDEGIWDNGLGYLILPSNKKYFNKRRIRKLRNFNRYCYCNYQLCDRLLLELGSLSHKWYYLVKVLRMLILLLILAI